MNKMIFRKIAAFTACLALCAGASCGKVERTDGKENVTVSGTDSSGSTENASQENSSTDPQILTIPVESTENDTQSTSDENLPVSGQPATEAPSGHVASGGTTENTTSGNGGGVSGNAAEVTAISLSFTEVKLSVGGSKMPIVTMSPATAENKAEKWTSSDEKVATVDSLGNIKGVSEGLCIVTVQSVDNPAVSAAVQVTVEKAPEPAVADGATYISGMLIANKTYALPASYNPGGLTNECYSAFMNLVSAANADNINIYCSSGFRSYESQRQIYNNYVAMDGQAKADTYSARPGHSEHQTGLAIDCNIIDDSFTGTPEAIWLENNCHKYGFIIRYPRGKSHITGYKYEPWHIRYLGVENATAVYNSGLCLEEYLGITSQYTY